MRRSYIKQIGLSMAHSSFSEQNGELDNVLRPRPIKPGNPMVLRTQVQEAGLKPFNGIEALPLEISRFVDAQVLTVSSLTCHIVVGQPLFLQMHRPRSNPSHRQGNKSEPNKNSDYFLRSTMPPASLISIEGVTIEILGDSSSCSGLGWQLWC